jgi:hypothetical protein
VLDRANLSARCAQKFPPFAICAVVTPTARPSSRPRKEATMPAKSEKQRKFMGAELERKREGKKTQTNMSESELKKMASKPKKKS